MVGSKLREFRQARHLTQEEVAMAVHCDRSYLSRIETDRVVPPVDLLQSLCEFFGVPTNNLLTGLPPHDASGELLVRQCLSLLAHGRVAEAQTLAAASWWEYISGPSDVANQLFEVLMAAPNANYEVLTILLATLFRRAAAGHVDDAFFHYGYRLQIHLAEQGQLQSSQMVCQALLALEPDPSVAFRLTLSLGTTFWRLKDVHLARAWYSKARMLWRQGFSRINFGRVLHGMGTCHLALSEIRAGLLLTQDALNLYGDEAPDLYHLALQNVAVGHQISGDHGNAQEILEQCAQYWGDHGDAVQVQEIERLLRESTAVQPRVDGHLVGG